MFKFPFFCLWGLVVHVGLEIEKKKMHQFWGRLKAPQQPLNGPCVEIIFTLLLSSRSKMNFQSQLKSWHGREVLKVRSKREIWTSMYNSLITGQTQLGISCDVIESSRPATKSLNVFIFKTTFSKIKHQLIIPVEWMPFENCLRG